MSCIVRVHLGVLVYQKNFVATKKVFTMQWQWHIPMASGGSCSFVLLWKCPVLAVSVITDYLSCSQQFSSVSQS